MTEKSYELRRSNRRTLALTLDRQGRLMIHAPMRMPLRTIEAFLLEKQDWIARKRQELSAAESRTDGFSLREGGCIPYLGGELRLSYDSVRRAEVQKGVLVLPRTGSPAQHVLNWLAEQARRELPAYVEKWAHRMQVYPTALSFGYAKARYGSMTSDGRMRLNVALMHFPAQYIDYVVVHELAHRVHPDHSPAFHAYVESVLPGAGQLRKEMKTLSGYLTLLRELNEKDLEEQE